MSWKTDAKCKKFNGHTSCTYKQKKIHAKCNGHTSCAYRKISCNPLFFFSFLIDFSTHPTGIGELLHKQIKTMPKFCSLKCSTKHQEKKDHPCEFSSVTAFTSFLNHSLNHSCTQTNSFSFKVLCVHDIN